MEQDRNAFRIQRTKAPDLDDLQRTWEGMGRTLRSIERACAAVNESKELLIKLSRQLPSPSEHFEITMYQASDGRTVEARVYSVTKGRSVLRVAP